MWIRWVLLAAGALAALMVGRDAPNLVVVEGILGIAVIAAVAIALALLTKR